MGTSSFEIEVININLTDNETFNIIEDCEYFIKPQLEESSATPKQHLANTRDNPIEIGLKLITSIVNNNKYWNSQGNNNLAPRGITALKTALNNENHTKLQTLQNTRAQQPSYFQKFRSFFSRTKTTQEFYDLVDRFIQNPEQSQVDNLKKFSENIKRPNKKVILHFKQLHLRCRKHGDRWWHNPTLNLKPSETQPTLAKTNICTIS